MVLDRVELTYAPKLSNLHLFPTKDIGQLIMYPIDTQKVDPALTLFSQSNIDILRDTINTPESRALATYLQAGLDLYDAHDVDLMSPSVPRTITSAPERHLTLAQRIELLEGAHAVFKRTENMTEDTSYVALLCCTNFVKLVEKLTKEGAAECLRPRVCSSNMCETFFSIIRQKRRIFTVYEFAACFGKTTRIMQQQQAGHAITQYWPVTGTTNNLTKYVIK